MGGSSNRMASFAELVAKEIGHLTVENMTKTDRYSLYKIGPVISVNVRMCTRYVSLLQYVR